MKPYILEIYPPGDSSSMLIDFESDRPFLSINVGDVIDPVVWPDLANGPSYRRLRVAAVIHMLMKSGDDVIHKIVVHTEYPKAQ